MLNRQELFSQLFRAFLERFPNVEAIIVSDFEGLIIAGDKREEIDMELVSMLSTLVNPIISRIQKEYSFELFGSGAFDTDEYRLLFISIDKETILSLILKSLTSIDNISPYAYFLAEKVAQILNATEIDVIQLKIPDFKEEEDRHRKLKEQICQISDSDEKGSYAFKFIIVGDHKVGKTSLIRRFVEKKFGRDYRATIGLNVLSHTFEFQGNQILLALWDVGAQAYFKRFRKIYYSGAEAAFIVYDMTNNQSFENIKVWYQELRDFTEGEDLPVVLVANKLDLTDRAITREEGLDLSETLSPDGVSYIETSALNGENVEDAFKLIAYHYMLRIKQKERDFIKNELLGEIQSTLKDLIILELSFITESMSFSPGFQAISEMESLGDYSIIKDNPIERLYAYKNGLIINNFTYIKYNLANTDGTFIIFDAREKEHIDPDWKELLLDIIQKMRKKRVVIVGIRISDNTNWSTLMDEFNIEENLEEKLISVIFVKIGPDFREKIYDNIKVMLNAIISTRAL